MALLNTKPGDLFAIPAHARDGTIGYVVARHIAMQYTVPLFEVFNTVYQSPPAALAELNLTTRLFRPVPMLLQFNKTTIPTAYKWRILFNDPNYNPEQSAYSKIQIGYHASGDTMFDLWVGGEKRKVSKAEILLTEDAEWWTPLNLCIRASAHLAGLVGPEEPYDIWKVVGLTKTPANQEEFLNRFNALMAKGMNACEIMANRFKQWDLEKKEKGRKRTPTKK